LYVSVGTVECSTLEPEPFHGEDDASLRACAEKWHLQEVVCEVDGEAIADLEAFQVTSTPMHFELQDQNMVGVAGGGSGRSVAAGIGVLVEPLAVGNHTVLLHSYYAEAPADSLSQMTYEITVVDPPRLSVRSLPSSGLVELSWPETADYVLQQRDALNSDDPWDTATVVSSEFNNGTRVVTIATSAVPRFLRLELR